MTAIRHLRALVEGGAEHHDGIVSGLLVPYDSPAWVRDESPSGGYDDYREGFRRGAFDSLLAAGDPKAMAGRVALRHMHDRNDGLGYLGIGRDFHETDAGLFGSFQVVYDKRGSVVDLTKNGINGLSIEFRERPKGTVEEDGVRWRTDAWLDGVALEWRGAYSEAQVLAYRAHDEELAAEKAQQEQAEREQKQADAAAAQAVADREAQAVEAKRKQAEVDAWLAEQESKQAELAARYK